ncbi:hypothetical protein [Photobacterium sp. 1_MG-2023]|uniref:hypothetical protein n=1 Tax=Photobacterium sp. 1_MG-2023 TaxID=3062646 RepID=UPI0026E1C8E5|nr:hypothetical protein [Photobacterium sp. 1_MG-2023]MDO6705922.1 hypothetical protein [Photobacterium sp. 1_MG-2023]
MKTVYPSMPEAAIAACDGELRRIKVSGKSAADAQGDLKVKKPAEKVRPAYL